MTCARSLLLAGLLGTTLAPAARAEEPQATTAAEPARDRVAAWVRGLGSPARPDALSGLPAAARTLAPDEALRVVAALRAAGGVEATQALAILAAHRSDEVRVEALRAIGAVGIRTPAATDAAREALADADPAAHLAAVEAVGRVGDGRDVALLIDRLEAPQLAVRVAALSSLRGISGVHLPASVARWRHWWLLSESAARTRLSSAIAAFSGPRETEVAAADHRAVVHYAWADLDAVVDEVRRWLRSVDPRLRVAGCRVAASVRLGAVAGDVRGVLRYARDPAVLGAAFEAADALGVSTEGVEPPPGSCARSRTGK